MDCRHGTLVTGVHSLQHVQSLAAAHLPDDQPVGTHPHRMPNQLAQRDGFLAAGKRFQAADVILLQP